MVGLYFQWPHPGREPPVRRWDPPSCRRSVAPGGAQDWNMRGHRPKLGVWGSPASGGSGSEGAKSLPLHTHTPCGLFPGLAGLPGCPVASFPCPSLPAKAQGPTGPVCRGGQGAGPGKGLDPQRADLCRADPQPQGQVGMAGVWQHGKRPYRPSAAASWCLRTRVPPEQLPVCQDPGIVLLEPPYSHVRSLIIPILLM